MLTSKAVNVAVSSDVQTSITLNATNKRNNYDFCSSMFIVLSIVQEEFEDSKDVIGIRNNFHKDHSKSNDYEANLIILEQDKQKSPM
jgi:hypothetical protein